MCHNQILFILVEGAKAEVDAAPDGDARQTLSS